MSSLFAEIVNAHQSLQTQVRTTPLDYSPVLSRLTGCEVYLKCEHLQYTGSFKLRGASNKLRVLGEVARESGVITASSGNHGQAVALAGKLAGISVTVYAPATVSSVKREAIRAFGAEVVLVEGDALAAELRARAAAQQEGKPFISPYNDIDVIAGQGTIGIELAEQCQDLDALFVSVGGGGLISGIATALETLSPQTEIVGCWPANASSMYRCLQAGDIIEVEESETLSDGTAGGVEPGAITFPLCQRLIGASVLVSEAEIKAALTLLADSERWIVEGAAGVALAGLLQRAEHHAGQKVAVVLCGRNIQLDKFISAVQGMAGTPRPA